MKRALYLFLYVVLKNIPSNYYVNRIRGLVVGMYARGSKKKFQIGRSVNISNPSALSIGDNVVINAEVYLISSKFTIHIGDNCLIAPRCFIQTLNHKYIDKNITINTQGVVGGDVTIGDDCWLSYGVVVLPGVNIKSGSVLGACSVVTKDTKSFGVYAGVPAKLIKERL